MPMLLLLRMTNSFDSGIVFVLGLIVLGLIFLVLIFLDFAILIFDPIDDFDLDFFLVILILLFEAHSLRTFFAMISCLLYFIKRNKHDRWILDCISLVDFQTD